MFLKQNGFEMRDLLGFSFKFTIGPFYKVQVVFLR